VEGLADACRALGLPVVGGNVSLYNEAPDGPIYPTPVVGMVGLLPDPERAPGVAFREEGHAVALIGPFAPSLAASELEKLRGRAPSGLEPVDLEAHARALEAIREAARSGALASAHDVSEGGLACALAECCIAGGVGARLELPAGDEAALFGEGPGGVVVSGPPEGIDALGGVTLGEVGGDSLELAAGDATLAVPVDDLRIAYESAIPDRLS
jgi:phosphoribosylformylglycinamidine synthase subunit PurL